MFVVVGFALVVAMLMVMRAMLPGVFVVVNSLVGLVVVFVGMLMIVRMAMLVSVLVGVGYAIVGVLMAVRVFMFVLMLMGVLVLAFHLLSPFWTGLQVFSRGRLCIARAGKSIGTSLFAATC